MQINLKLVRPFYTLGDDDDDLRGHLKLLLAQLHACETSRYLKLHSMDLQSSSFWPDGLLHILCRKEPLTFSTFLYIADQAVATTTKFTTLPC